MWNEHKHEFNGQNGRFKADQQYETVWIGWQVAAVECFGKFDTIKDLVQVDLSPVVFSPQKMFLYGTQPGTCGR
jgi:hypothetical protein